jgi:hypothetical protein
MAVPKVGSMATTLVEWSAVTWDHLTAVQWAGLLEPPKAVNWADSSVDRWAAWRGLQQAEPTAAWWAAQRAALKVCW